MSSQDTGKFRTNIKDQFYTNVEIAKECIRNIQSIIENVEEYIWIEPSAGNGSFYHNIPETVVNKIGIDIDPKADDIITQDYLSWNTSLLDTTKKVLILGNPPFGRQSSIAKDFIRKSCKFAHAIAFILPKSFVKPSMNNVFDLKFHCVYSNELGKNAFVLNNTKYDVPCVFQIWQKKNIERETEETVVPYKFIYIKATDEYDIAFRRVGGLAGKCYDNNGTKYSIQSHHFLKLDNDLSSFIDEIITKINEYTFPSNTVGPRSLSKSEINKVINSVIRSLPLPS